MTTQSPVQNQSLATSQRTSLWICNGLIVLMIACLGFASSQLSIRYFPALNGGYLPWLCILIAIEAIYSFHHIPDLEFRDQMIFRVAELLTIALLFRFFLLLKNYPLAAILPEISSWQTNFFGGFINPEFILGILLLGFTWGTTTQMTGLLDQLHDREKDAVWDEMGKLQNALQEIRKQVISRAVTIGGIVVVFTIITRMNLRDFIQIGDLKFNQGASTFIVLIYAVLTLALLSQTQFALLRTRWVWAKSPISARLTHNWVTYSLVFLGILGLLAFLMPTDYSMGFFQTIGFLFGLIFQIGQWLIIIILLPFTLLAQLFKSPAHPETQSPIQSIPQAAPTPPPLAQPFPWWNIIQSVLFWGVLVAVVSFALIQYLRLNSNLWTRFRALPLNQWLSHNLSLIWEWIKGVNRSVTTYITQQIKKLQPVGASTISSGRRPRKSGSLSSRDHVIDLYLTLLQVGKENGVKRRASQTPYQYSQDLIHDLPDVTTEVSDITEAFVEARYTRHPIPEEQVSPLRREWERIKNAFHKRPPSS